jgi:hypothetical protein
MELAQQGWPAPPQGVHALTAVQREALEQLVETATQVLPLPQQPLVHWPLQQGCVRSPQAWQVPLTQPPLVHALLAQQGWLAPPHAVQPAAAQTRFVPHEAPDVTHWLAVLQQPPLHWPAEQQGWLAPPQPAHWPDGRQTSPELQNAPTARHSPVVELQQPAEHTLPAQQGWPEPPHAWHTRCALQTVFAPVHASPGQQGSPALPQATQRLLLHSVLAAVHEAPVQHIWPAPPQFPQLPFWHSPPPPGHWLPAATHEPATQQPPPPHWLPAQQGWPAPPHALHTPAPVEVHTDVGFEHWRPGQHCWPRSPQTTHSPLRQVAPCAVQVLPAQQGWPAPPQVLHTPPPAQTVEPAVHWPLAQQGWPAPPQVPQLPFWQVPWLPGQAEPAATHSPLAQQPPAEQVLAAQQAAPVRPQGRERSPGGAPSLGWARSPEPLSAPLLL